MRTLWLWLPDEALALVIIGIGLALIIGLIRGRAAMGLLGTVVLVLLAGPFIDALLDTLPGWMLFLLLLFVAVALFRGALSLLLGARAADEAVGNLAADVIRVGFRLLFLLLFLPFRILWWAFRRV
jgi:hypothetical protein